MYLRTDFVAVCRIIKVHFNSCPVFDDRSNGGAGFWFGPEADVTDVVRIIIDIGWEVDGVESPG